jgi:hypothetical protein
VHALGLYHLNTIQPLSNKLRILNIPGFLTCKVEKQQFLASKSVGDHRRRYTLKEDSNTYCGGHLVSISRSPEMGLFHYLPTACFTLGLYRVWYFRGE